MVLLTIMGYFSGYEFAAHFLLVIRALMHEGNAHRSMLMGIAFVIETISKLTQFILLVCYFIKFESQFENITLITFIPCFIFFIPAQLYVIFIFFQLWRNKPSLSLSSSSSSSSSQQPKQQQPQHCRTDYENTTMKPVIVNDSRDDATIDSEIITSSHSYRRQQ